MPDTWTMVTDFTLLRGVTLLAAQGPDGRARTASYWYNSLLAGETHRLGLNERKGGMRGG